MHHDDPPATMTAVRWHARNDVRVERIPRPSAPGPGELLLDIDACGICGTDIEEWRHGPINIAVEQHPLTRRRAPLTLGHEFCGTVTAAGPGTAIGAGTRVAVEVNIACGACARCADGDTQLCPRLGSLGLHGDGGLAEAAVVPESVCVPLPDGLPVLRAVLAEPLAVSIRAVRLAGVDAGDSVLVLGGGTIGQLAARLAARAGAGVLLVEPHPRRRAIAERAGIATAAPEPGTGGGPGADTPHGPAPTADIGSGPGTVPPEGADIVLDCVGFPGSVATAAAAARPGGRVAVLGVSTGGLDLSAWDLIRREQQVMGVLSHTLADFTEAVTVLAEGGIDVSEIVTGTVPLADAVDGAFVPLRDASADHLKLVVTPDAKAGTPAEG